MLKKSFYLVLKDIRNYVRQYSCDYVLEVQDLLHIVQTMELILYHFKKMAQTFQISRCSNVLIKI
jgi:hypothetical protein